MCYFILHRVIPVISVVGYARKKRKLASSLNTHVFRRGYYAQKGKRDLHGENTIFIFLKEDPMSKDGLPGNNAPSDNQKSAADFPSPAGSGSEDNRFLKNPLPVPKRRPHVRMDFDLKDDWDISEDLDYFDIEIDDDDDYDI